VTAKGNLKRLGLATVVALVTVWGLAGVASATIMEPANTAFTMTSTNAGFGIHGGSSGNLAFSCGHSVLTGTTPVLSPATWVAFSAAPTYDNCILQGITPVTVTPSEACQTGSSRPIFHVMGVSGATAAVKMTLPAACTIHIFVPVLSCTMTITGGQTIGNGTPGTGGGVWTNLGPKSTAHLDTAVIPTVFSTGSIFALCPVAGVHAGTVGGDFTVASATNVTVTP
jgi:hypothetical protein